MSSAHPRAVLYRCAPPPHTQGEKSSDNLKHPGSQESQTLVSPDCVLYQKSIKRKNEKGKKKEARKKEREKEKPCTQNQNWSVKWTLGVKLRRDGRVERAGGVYGLNSV